MSTPSSWPPPGPAPVPQGQPSPYGPPQGYAQPAPYAQPVPYGQGHTQPVPQGYTQPVPQGYTQPMPYAGPPVPAPAPRPERALMPGVWWSLVINLVVTVVLGLGALLIGWALVEFIAAIVGEDLNWRDALSEDQFGGVVLVVALIMVGAVLVSWGLTVVALALWRLIRGFRTIPPFVQALVAFVTMWVVTSVFSVVLQVVFGIFSSASSGVSGTY